MHGYATSSKYEEPLASIRPIVAVVGGHHQRSGAVAALQVDLSAVLQQQGSRTARGLGRRRPSAG